MFVRNNGISRLFTKTVSGPVEVVLSCVPCLSHDT